MPYAPTMGMGGGSKTSAGCGAFGLVGVLIAVGIVAWLFLTSSDLLPSRSGKDRSAQTTTAAPPDAPDLVTVTVDPANGLGAAPEVNVSAEGWAPGSDITLSTCLSGAGLVLGGESPCDPESTVTVLADESGSISSTYRVDRIVTAGGLPYDCANGGVACAVRVTGASPDDREATGEAIVAFQTGLLAPDLLDELGS